MRLYYMTTLETLEKFILPEQRIRLSTFDTVNDPFELLGAVQGDREMRRQFEWLYNHWVATLGFVSFSDSWKSPLMWAHYARNHTGVCLGVEVPDQEPMRINYEPHRLRTLLDMDMTRLETAVDEDIVRTVITTKFHEWAYEREWRIVVKLAEKDPETGFHYNDFTPNFELREIIVGARCVRSPQEIAEQVFGVTAPVSIKKARPAFGTFSMVLQQQVHPISVEPLKNLPLKWGRRKPRLLW